MNPSNNEIEVSVVIPCLNESDTLKICLDKIQKVFAEYGIMGEVIVADNGSSDGSIEIAREAGVLVVPVEQRGYGRALMGGIEASKGRYIIMGDADNSYDFLELPLFVQKLREGFDLVQGCRLPSGKGKISKGAMPFLHRHIGNPLLSFLVKKMFRSKINDVYCGFRGFTKDLYFRLGLQCTGMEFATEMIIKATLMSENITEVPITLYPDGRISHPPHLKTFRDGWRTIRFFLISCPRWLFLFPGIFLITAGFAAYILALPGFTIRGIHFDAHTLLFGTLAIICGYQSIIFGVFAKVFAISEGLIPEDNGITRFLKVATLERGIFISLLALFAGLALLISAVNQWRLVSFGNLVYSETMRLVVPGAALTVLGFQTLLSSFFISILRMHRKS